VSEPGNLYASLLLTDPAPPQRAAGLSLVAAIAVHDALAACAPMLGPRLKLKWPNDVLCDGAKLAGILVEGESVPLEHDPEKACPAPDAGWVSVFGQRSCSNSKVERDDDSKKSHPALGPLAVVIGIGVNCAHHPPDTAYPATNLADAGALVAPESLAQALIAAMARRLVEWERGVNFAATRAAWLKRAAGLGAPARVRLADRDIDGIAETLDEAGRLVLRLADGTRERIAAGEMFPLMHDPEKWVPVFGKDHAQTRS
jgi:BirA family transcriptional regulator, biotin operon repressor / biotin---[acetyl-CoA-carboxylase] ligase